MKKNKPGFIGGIHPTNGMDKSLTANKKIIGYVPSHVNVSMKQGLGPACQCIVNVGDHVNQGQVIGESQHFLSAHVHAPVTGKVLSIENGFCEIEVESCSLIDDSVAYNQNWADISAYSKEELIEQLKNGGLVGMGGAGFPTAVKYQTKDPITHVLINGAECEPYLTCDEHIMLEQGMAFLNGVQILKKAAGAKQAIICMEDNKVHCKEHLEKLLEGHNDEISIMLLPTKYPQGGERQLILASMNVEIPAGQLPSSVGAIVSNVQTAKAAADQVLGGQPSISRCITITGDVNEPNNYIVPLGTNLGELLEKSNDVKSKDNRIILGGPMTGKCIGENKNANDLKNDHTLTLTKTSGGLIVLEGYHPVESACIRCGRCGSVCPVGLSPFKIDMAYRKGNIELCQQLNATECIACGCCSYACPAKRELTQNVVKARDAVRAKMREEANK